MSDTFSPERQRFTFLTSEINAVYHEAALKLGLSDSACMILYAICSNGDECLLHDICMLSGVSKQTVNSALRKLERDGVVQVCTHTGRMKNVRLTEHGKQLCEKTVFHLIHAENDIFASWTKEEREQYLALTQKYLTLLKGKIQEL